MAVGVAATLVIRDDGSSCMGRWAEKQGGNRPISHRAGAKLEREGMQCQQRKEHVICFVFQHALFSFQYSAVLGQSEDPEFKAQEGRRVVAGWSLESGKPSANPVLEPLM